jgi:ATP-dependent helicase HrpB
LPFANLPVDSVLDPLRAALRASTGAVLQAPPGAGKTTRVPLALLDERWLGGARLVMLEPRRLAARAAARRLAESLGTHVGGIVGYRMRLDTRVGPTTRLEVVTEGVLTRLLQHDPTLDGIGLLVFDEFHERSLHADLGLALALEAQRLVRPDLRILVMSATLDVAPVARLLGDVPVIASEGREFPVATHYLREPLPDRRDPRLIESRLVSTIEAALRENDGDVLVFLPGAAEIRRVEARLRELVDPARVVIAPLHGNLSAEAQDLAIAASPPGQRKIVLATSIAETSLTIEGVRVVVDGGLARVPRFSARTGMTRLETVRVNRASAEQRRGRAGRLGPGVCHRLWTEIEHGQLVPRATPEILEADLAPLALELAIAGIVDPLELGWLDPPPAASLAQARELLQELEAIDVGGRPTEHGKAIARLALHPRLAHMILRAIPLELGLTACRVAALLNERDLLRGEGGAPAPEVDLRTRLELLARRARDRRVDSGALRRVDEEASHLARQLHAHGDDPGAAGLLVAFAYPDRIAQRRRGGARGRFVLRNGRGAAIDAADPLGDAEFLAVAAVDDRQPESRVWIAAPLERAALEEQFAAQIVEERIVEWDDRSESVLARRRRRLGALVLADEPLRDADPSEIARALAGSLAGAGVDALPWSEGARRLRERLAFLHHTDPTWPDVSDAALAASMEAWLAPRIVGMRRRDDVARLDLGAALLDRLSWAQRGALDELAPTHFVTPSGSRLPIDYGDPSAPVLAVRLQEMFGLAETPRVGGARVALTLHLLSPAQRPLQVTRDLAGFWRASYFDVQREMRGRYPKHDWPDDPLAATPTSRAKRRKR